MSRTLSHPARRNAAPLALAGLVVALLAPLVVIVAAVGLKAGLWGVSVAFDLLTLKVALVLAGIGAVAGLAALMIGLSAPREAGLIGVAAALMAGATAGMFAVSILHAAQAVGQGDVSTDSVDTPAFSESIRAARAAGRADPVSVQATASGCDIAALDTQVAPGVAGYALNAAGFDVRGMGVGRSDGTRTGDWFGFSHDAVVRIRPDRTDVRVTARDRAHDRGEACRLARKIIDGLTA